MEGTKQVVYEIENRSKRSFIVGLHEVIKGGRPGLDANKKPVNIYIEPDSIVQVTEICGKILLEGYKNEIRLIRKINRKG